MAGAFCVSRLQAPHACANVGRAEVCGSFGNRDLDFRDDMRGRSHFPNERKLSTSQYKEGQEMALQPRKEAGSDGVVKQYLKRSEMVAKQVITLSDALSVGYVSQLWVDSREWNIKAIELKSTLLFGETEGILLSSLLKVGDVVLLEDEGALQGDLHLPSFDTVVGLNVVTEDGNRLGKVRDYVFDVLGGNISYIEFDKLGVSLVPANVISTYGILIEDVLDSTADTIWVRSGVEARVRRLTTGVLEFNQTSVDRTRRRKSRRTP